jgi:hypothetical protein
LREGIWSGGIRGGALVADAPDALPRRGALSGAIELLKSWLTLSKQAGELKIASLLLLEWGTTQCRVYATTGGTPRATCVR